MKKKFSSFIISFDACDNWNSIREDLAVFYSKSTSLIKELIVFNNNNNKDRYSMILTLLPGFKLSSCNIYRKLKVWNTFLVGIKAVVQNEKRQRYWKHKFPTFTNIKVKLSQKYHYD